MSNKKYFWYSAIVISLLVAVAVPLFAGPNPIMVPPGFSGLMGTDLNMDDNDIINPDEMYCVAPTTDASARDMSISAAHAYAQATGANATGGDLALAGGIGPRNITIDNFANCAGDTVDIGIWNAWTYAETTLTEGVEWSDDGGDNNSTATSLAAAVDTLTGVSATAVAAVVYITPDSDTLAVMLQEGDATCTTTVPGYNAAYSGNDLGGVLFPAPGGSAYDLRIGPYLGSSYEEVVALLFGPRTTSGTYFFCGNGSCRIMSGNGDGTYDDIRIKGIEMSGGDIEFAATGYAYWKNRGNMSSPSNGQITFQDAARTTGFTLDIDDLNGYGLAKDLAGTGAGGLGSVTAKGAKTLMPPPKIERLTFAANPGDASKVTTGSIIPAGAFVVGVSSRVITAGTNCTDIDIGIAAKDTDAFADGTAIADATTTTMADGNAGADFSAAGLGITPSIAAQEITVTANGGNCFDLVIDIAVHYFSTIPQTAD